MATVLQRLMVTVARDGRIDAGEVAQLVAQAQKRGVSATEKKQLGQFLKTQADAFEPQAKQALTAFLDAKPLPPVSKDPELLPGHTYPYREVPDGTLFVDGVSVNDVAQGQAGSCYFMSALSAIALRDPKVLENAVVDNLDGTFTVRLFDSANGSKPNELVFGPQYVRVDADFPTSGSRPAYSHGTVPTELWPAVFEKALAALRGGYDDIGRGGHSDWAFRLLTDEEAKGWAVNPKFVPRDFAWQKLQEALVTGRPTTADSMSTAASSQVVKSHAYTVLGTETKGGKDYVVLRNPWGFSRPGREGLDDGTVKLRFDVFCENFLGFTTAGPW